MSLLEDVFLEDEASEAQDLERIIEGDGYDDQERNSDDDDDGNAEGRDDEAEEDKRRVDPNSAATKKVVRNPRFVLNPARLTGPRGIQVIPEHFKNFKFKGKGHEKDDLDMVLKKLEHWAYRLYPKFKFEDCLKKMEMLGKKRQVAVHLHKIRSDQYTTEDTIIQKDSSDDEGPAVLPAVAEDEDEFDKLLQQQIQLAHTPAAKKVMAGDVGTPMSMPKATSSPSISEEQKQRMLENRAKAEQRRLAKLSQVHTGGIGGQADKESVNLTTNDQIVKNDPKKDGSHINLATDLENSQAMHLDDDITQETYIDLTNGEIPKQKSKDNLNLNGKPYNIDSVVDLTEKTDIPVSRKRKSNIIDDSDDDAKSSDEFNAFENKEFDAVMNGSDISVGIKTDVNKKADNNVFKDDDIVDLTDVSVKQNKRTRKTNVIDSSDEECDVTAEDISISVDIHRENSQPQKDKVRMQENNLDKELIRTKYKNNKLSDVDEDEIQTNNDLESSNVKKMNIAVSPLQERKMKETNKDRFEKQTDLENTKQSDQKSDNGKTTDNNFEKQTNINLIETSDNQIDKDFSEKSDDNITNEDLSKKQKRIDEIETNDDEIDEDMNEIGSEKYLNTTSDNIVNVFMEKQANNRLKETISLETTRNREKEARNSFENANSEMENVIDNNLVNVNVNKGQESVGNNSEAKISLDDVMDVDFSEEF